MLQIEYFTSKSNAPVSAKDLVNKFLKDNDGKIKVNDIKFSSIYEESSGYVLSSFMIIYEVVENTTEEKTVKSKKKE